MSILTQIINDKQKIERGQIDSSQFLFDLFKNLTDKEIDILKRRFGLLGNTKETLKKVGLKHEITRERIRQIQAKTLNKLKNIKDLEFFKPLENIAILLLEEYGQIVEEEFFLDKLSGKFQKGSQEDQNHRRNLIFIFSHLSQIIERTEKNSLFKVAWRLKSFSFEKMKTVIEEAKKILQEKKRPLKEELINDLVNLTKLNKKHILSYLKISKEIEKDIFGQWGLASWPEVRPRKLRDKIYLILKKEDKPLHFKKITELVNKQFKEKTNYASTVHNELISDKRFILVGRGIYGLQEQGYKPGVVADVVIDVLKKENQLMHRNRLIEAVLKQRLVKRQTVVLALLTLRKQGKIKKKGRREYVLHENIRTLEH